MKIFIIHGWTYNLLKWPVFCDELRKLSLEPVQLKVPGLTAPLPGKPWTIDEYVEWLRGQLKNESNPVVIGHSNGGRIALNYVKKYPSHLGRLILIDSAGVPHQQTRSTLKLDILKVIAKIGKPLGFIPGLRKLFYKLIGGKDYFEAGPNMRLTMRNMLKADEKTDFASVDLPVTIIWGKEDKQTPLSDGESMASSIKGAKLHIIEGARHAPFFTHPKEAAKIVAEATKN